MEEDGDIDSDIDMLMDEEFMELDTYDSQIDDDIVTPSVSRLTDSAKLDKEGRRAVVVLERLKDEVVTGYSKDKNVCRRELKPTEKICKENKAKKVTQEGIKSSISEKQKTQEKKSDKPIEKFNEKDGKTVKKEPKQERHKGATLEGIKSNIPEKQKTLEKKSDKPNEKLNEKDGKTVKEEPNQERRDAKERKDKDSHEDKNDTRTDIDKAKHSLKKSGETDFSSKREHSKRDTVENKEKVSSESKHSKDKGKDSKSLPKLTTEKKEAVEKATAELYQPKKIEIERKSEDLERKPGHVSDPKQTYCNICKLYLSNKEVSAVFKVYHV